MGALSAVKNLVTRLRGRRPATVAETTARDVNGEELRAGDIVDQATAPASSGSQTVVRVLQHNDVRVRWSDGVASTEAGENLVLVQREAAPGGARRKRRRRR